VTVVVDRPERIREWYGVIDACTRTTGLVTSEIVPAFRVVSPRASTTAEEADVRRSSSRAAVRGPRP